MVREMKLPVTVLSGFLGAGNGIRPPAGIEVSVAIAAYITWLSTDQPIRMNNLRPAGPNAIRQLTLESTQANRQRGQKLYAARCASCHADHGQGDKENPPLWGARSTPFKVFEFYYNAIVERGLRV